jgi:hypothetical protein
VSAFAEEVDGEDEDKEENETKNACDDDTNELTSGQSASGRCA